MIVLVIGLAVLTCVAPLAFYFCWLASVQRRRTVVIVPGLLDGLYALLGCFGCMLVGGVLLLALAHSDPRILVQGHYDDLRDIWQRKQSTWVFTLVGFLLLLAALIAVTLRNRVGALSVYNITGSQLDPVLAQALENAGWTAIPHAGHTWSNTLEQRVELLPSYGQRHLHLRITAADDAAKGPIRELITCAIRNAPVAADGNAASILTTVATTLVLLMLLVVLMMCYLIYFK